MQAQYINRRGKLVPVKITWHALRRFMYRWSLVFPTQPITANGEAIMVDWFNRAQLIDISKTRKQYQRRRDTHGKDSMYFLGAPFVFVVQAAAIVTVELAENRELNKVHGRIPPPSPPPPTASRNIEHPDHAPTVFQLSATLRCGDKLTVVGLSSYPILGNPDPAALKDDRAFVLTVQSRIQTRLAQRPGYELVAVYAKVGGKGAEVRVLEN